MGGKKTMKILRVDMSKQTVKGEEIPEAYAGLGGRGLTSTVVNREVPPRCDPLDPENRLVFAPGLLSGTSLINTSRVSIGGKSPLTGTIKESNVGGTAGTALGKLGIAAIVVEGASPDGKLFLLRIDERGEAAFVPADAFRKMRTYGFVDRMLEAYGRKTAVLAIGPAGELGLAVASVQSSDLDGRPCRAAGRGGMGAVMGSKGLKAVVVDRRGKQAEAIADPETFKKAARDFAAIVKADPRSGGMMPSLGTAGLVGPVNSLGAFPSYNARKGVFEGWERISGEALAELLKKRGGNTTHKGCSQCIVNCSNEFVDPQGRYVTGSLEYETLWSMGGMTGIDDLDTIARMDRLCDDIGLDTMSMGVALAVAMDAGYKAFGDKEGALEMIEETAEGTAFGRILGNGPAAVGAHFGQDRVPVVKGQSIAAYDPRAMQGNGVTYATSPMGADHTAGNLLGEYLAGNLDPLSPEGQVEASRRAQIAIAALDCTGLCLFAGFCLARPEASEAFLRAMNARWGTRLAPEDLSAMGLRVLREEREFNRRAGFTNEDDRLPRFFYEEPLPPHNTTVRITEEDLDRTFDF
jgi:aldehyde:ferredoxin oxidoreductase